MKSNLRIGVFVTLLLMVGCREGSFDLSKKYYGVVTKIANGRVETLEVFARVRNKSKSEIKVDIVGITTEKLVGQVNLEISKDGVELSSSFIPGTNHPRLKRSGTCAKTKSGSAVSARVCGSKKVLSILIDKPSANYRMSGYFTTTPPEEIQSTLVEYSLEDLHELVKTSSFSTALEAERVYSTKMEVAMNRGNMLPHVNMRTLLAAVEGLAFSPAGLIDEVSNLVPFLFPTKWYGLSQSKYEYEAQKASFKSLVANEMLMLEGLYLSVLQDQAYLDALGDHHGKLSDLHSFVQQQEQHGVVDPGSARAFRNMMISLEQDQISFEETQQVQLYAISKAVGLQPSKGVSALKPVALPEIDDSFYLEPTKHIAAALEASLEIQQLLHLDRAAYYEKLVTKWSFLDPEGDPRYGIGFGRAPGIEIKKSKLRQVRKQREIFEQEIERKIMEVGRNINSLVRRHILNEEALQNADLILTRELAAIEQGESFDPNRVREVLDEALRYNLVKSALGHRYLFLSAQWKRLLRTDRYSGDDVGEGSKAIFRITHD